MHGLLLVALLLLVQAPGGGLARADQPGGYNAGPDNLTALGSAGDPPQLLRGSAVRARSAPPEGMRERRWTVAAGERLWLVDARAGEVVACRLFDTSTVGRRVVRCYAHDEPLLLPVE